MLDVRWTLIVEIPQLDALTRALTHVGERAVAELTGIQEAINSLVTNQAAGQDALSAHLAAIEAEIKQLGESPSQAELDHLAEQVHAAAATAAKGAQELRAMTEQVSGMVPETPA